MFSTTDNATSRTVLVTGAAGLIGVPVVRCLLAQGLRVVAVDNGSAGTLHRLDEFADNTEVCVRVLDVRHHTDLVDVMATERPWGVMHLAARHFIPDCDTSPVETVDINVLGTQHVVNACALHPPRRLVFASTADVYAPSDCPHGEDDHVEPPGVYGRSKLLAERMLREQAYRLGDCESTVARLFNVYGPGDPHPHLLPEILRQAQRTQVLHLGDLTESRDFVYVDDVAEALVVLLRAGGPTMVNVGAGTAVSGHDLVNLVAHLTGRHLETRVDPARLRGRARPVSCATTTRLRAVVPSWPRTSLSAGIQRTIMVEQAGRPS